MTAASPTSWRMPMQELVDEVAPGTLHVQVGRVFHLDEIVGGAPDHGSEHGRRQDRRPYAVIVRRPAMPTLFYSPGACSLAVHIVLEWIGAPYEAVRVDHHAPEYRQINPAGAVPAFDYGGDRPLTQCSAILMYLAQRHPEANLLDDRSPEAASQVQKWAAFLTGDLHPAFFPLFMPGRYTISKEPAAQADVAAAGPSWRRRSSRFSSSRSMAMTGSLATSARSSTLMPRRC